MSRQAPRARIWSAPLLHQPVGDTAGPEAVAAHRPTREPARDEHQRGPRRPPPPDGGERPQQHVGLPQGPHSRPRWRRLGQQAHPGAGGDEIRRRASVAVADRSAAAGPLRSSRNRPGRQQDEHYDGVPVPVGDARIEVVTEGDGDPVLLVQTALCAEELRPLCRQPALAGHRLIRTHRRGYAGSSSVTGIRSITDEAADCVALLDALGVERAHVVGLSYSSTVALQLALDVPHRVHTLTLLEAPPLHVPSVVEFRAAIDELAAARAAHGAVATLDLFQRRFLGPGWRAEVERAVRWRR